ncbi:tetratricopeptide repeat protein [Mycolicibacterium thermoresistibile]
MVLQSALTEDPHNPELLTRYALVRYDVADYSGAGAAAYAALAVAPTEVRAMAVYTLVLHRHGRHAEALSMGWTTADTHRDSGFAQYAYATVLAECGHLTEALSVIDRVIQLDAAVATYWTLRGDICRQLWGPAAALPNYQEALRLDPGDGWAMRNLADSRLPGGTVNRGLRPLVRAYESNPELLPFLHDEIAKALGRVLWAGTVFAAPLIIAFGVAQIGHEPLWTTLAPRVLAAASTVGSVAVIVWVLRTVPDPMLRSMLRTYRLLAGRLLFTIVVVVMGATVVVLGTTPQTFYFVPLLILGLAVLSGMGWFRPR